METKTFVDCVTVCPIRYETCHVHDYYANEMIYQFGLTSNEMAEPRYWTFGHGPDSPCVSQKLVPPSLQLSRWYNRCFVVWTWQMSSCPGGLRRWFPMIAYEQKHSNRRSTDPHAVATQDVWVLHWAASWRAAMPTWGSSPREDGRLKPEKAHRVLETIPVFSLNVLFNFRIGSVQHQFGLYISRWFQIYCRCFFLATVRETALYNI